MFYLQDAVPLTAGRQPIFIRNVEATGGTHACTLTGATDDNGVAQLINGAATLSLADQVSVELDPVAVAGGGAGWVTAQK